MNEQRDQMMKAHDGPMQAMVDSPFALPWARKPVGGRHHARKANRKPARKKPKRR
jgi:hypothetical protein